MEDDSRLENERLLEFLYLCPVGLAQVGPRGEVELMNSMGAQLLLPITDGQHLTNLFDVLDRHVPELRNLVRLYREPRGTVCEGIRIPVGDGLDRRRPEVLSVGVVKIDEARYMAVVQDISRTVKQERLLFDDQQRFHAIFEGMRDAMICMLDDAGRVATWNTSGERLLGYSETEVTGVSFSDLCPDPADSWTAVLDRVRGAGWAELQGWYQKKGASRFWAEGVIAALRDQRGGVTGFSVVLRDMTDRKVAADRLLELATRDDLTGLINRRHFLEQAEKEVSRFGRYGGALSLLMIDCDHFKSINDTYGHAGGDDVLRDIGRVLTETVRASDTAGRFGGEEFVVLLPGTSADGALAAAERIREAVAGRRVVCESAEIEYTVSVGVAVMGPAMRDLKAMVAGADAAMYAAKAAGRNRSSMHDAS